MQEVVVDNFNEIVNDPTKDVLVDFYIPTCGGCRVLEPILVEVADKVGFSVCLMQRRLILLCTSLSDVLYFYMKAVCMDEVLYR